MLSALALGRNLSVIDLRGVNGLTPLHVSNMRSVLNQNCGADVYVLCPSKGFSKPVLSAKHAPMLLSLVIFLAQISLLHLFRAGFMSVPEGITKPM